MYLSDALPPQPVEMKLIIPCPLIIMLIRYLAVLLRPCTGFGKQVRRLLNKQFKAIYDGCASQPIISLKTKWHCLLNTLPIWPEN